MRNRVKLAEVDLNTRSMPGRNSTRLRANNNNHSTANGFEHFPLNSPVQRSIPLSKPRSDPPAAPRKRILKKPSVSDMKFSSESANSVSLVDNRKKEWQIGNFLGKGGFAVVHTAIPKGHQPTSIFGEKDFVVKIEPKASGPLFVECTFYRKVVQCETVLKWLKKNNKKFIGLCYSLGFGVFEHLSKEYRFIVIPKLHGVLTDLWLRSKKRFHITTVLQMGMHMIDVLRYIHDQGFVHSDLKESNLMTQMCESSSCEVLISKLYLIDFGLASQYLIGDKHRPFKIEPKSRHDGTIEYCSLDSHDGVACSRRSDLQILIFFLLRMFSGYLPWEKFTSNKDLVADEKRGYWRDFSSLIKDSLILNPNNLTEQIFTPASLKSDTDSCDFLLEFSSYVDTLTYEATPDYNFLYNLMEKKLISLQESSKNLRKSSRFFSVFSKTKPIDFDGYNIQFRPHHGTTMLSVDETLKSIPILNAKKRSLRRSSILSTSISMDVSTLDHNSTLPVKKPRKSRK